MSIRKFKLPRLIAAISGFMVASTVIAITWLPINVFANSVDIEAKGGAVNGTLVVTSIDKKLFQLKDFMPGDTKTSSVKITNKDTDGQVRFGFRVVKPTTPSGKNLADVINLKISDADTAYIYYDGALINIDIIGNPTNVSLGSLRTNGSKTLNFELTFPAIPVVGINHNDYQKADCSFDLIFSAIGQSPTVAPSTPPTNPPDTDTGEGGNADNRPLNNESAAESNLVLQESSLPLGAPQLVSQGEQQNDTTQAIQDDVTPAGAPDESRETIREEEIPIGKPAMPKTGEVSLVAYYTFGLALISAGILLVYRQKQVN